MYFYLLGGVFLGWALGANDAANIFGTAVTSRMLRFSRAALLASIFVILGAVLEGSAGMHTLSGLSKGVDLKTAAAISFSTALAVTILTILKLPISTSQSAVGAIIGTALAKSNAVNWSGLVKVVLCWVGTPIGAMIVSFILYHVLSFIIRKRKISFIRLDGYLRLGMITAGCYGAYALGANNVANVTGVFKGLGLFGLTGEKEILMLTLVGSISISLGIWTFSKRVMMTVGKSLYDLDAFTAFIAVLGQAITVHFYAWVGVPVSSSQAIVGAVLGIILVRGTDRLNKKPLAKIFGGWLAAPILSGIVAAIITFAMNWK